VNSSKLPFLTVEQAQKDIPVQMLSSRSPLRATILLASSGTDSEAYSNHVFNLKLESDSAPVASPSALRYGKLEEIHHIFRADPKSPPKLISIAFTAAVLVSLPLLLVSVSSLMCSKS
jgi:oligosaccharyltransferase complex subunit delta (ribophorin II)